MISYVRPPLPIKLNVEQRMGRAALGGAVLDKVGERIGEPKSAFRADVVAWKREDVDQQSPLRR